MLIGTSARLRMYSVNKSLFLNCIFKEFTQYSSACETAGRCCLSGPCQVGAVLHWLSICWPFVGQRQVEHQSVSSLAFKWNSLPAVCSKSPSSDPSICPKSSVPLLVFQDKCKGIPRLLHALCCFCTDCSGKTNPHFFFILCMLWMPVCWHQQKMCEIKEWKGIQLPCSLKWGCTFYRDHPDPS